MSETKCISKSTFVQGEPMFSDRQCSQPAVGPFSLLGSLLGGWGGLSFGSVAASACFLRLLAVR